jgi:hypothetical protein
MRTPPGPITQRHYTALGIPRLHAGDDVPAIYLFGRSYTALVNVAYTGNRLDYYDMQAVNGMILRVHQN